MDRTTWSKALAISAAITLLGGCASTPGAPPSPSGAAAAPSGTASAPAASVKPSPVGAAVTLHLADAEDQGRSSQPWIDAFIAKVSKDSGGTITVVPEYNAGGGNEGVPGEIVVAGQVIAGDVELALVPVRGWNDVGVTSLQALEAPLLVDSDALLTAVAADPLVQPLLERMGDQGLVGLSAWPDDLRHLFTWDQNGYAHRHRRRSPRCRDLRAAVEAAGHDHARARGEGGLGRVRGRRPDGRGWLPTRRESELQRHPLAEWHAHSDRRCRPVPEVPGPRRRGRGLQPAE